jgi:excinuclease ABC subunit C
VLERPSDIPAQPGVYRFRDGNGRVLYVGKAKSLRSRIAQYFADPSTLHPRTASLVQTATTVDFVTVQTEVEALTLEYSWIKEYDPRFNVKYRDDKSYPYVAITLGDEYPRVYVTREQRRKSTKYFGPYAHAWAIRGTIDELLWVFPIRSCRDGVFKRAAQTGRPCLLGYIGKCTAPCVGRIDDDAYGQLVEQFMAFLSGETGDLLGSLHQQMQQAAKDEQFEDAARFRDRIGALERSLTPNVVALDLGTEADLVAVFDQPLEMGVQVFHVRNGRVVGERAFVLEKDEDLTAREYMDRVLQHLYAMADISIPREVLVSQLPASLDSWVTLLSEVRGSAVDVRIPMRGTKRQLMEIVQQNAQASLERHQQSRARDLNTRSLALQQLQEALELPEAPLRIECIDISTIQGEHTVGSLVVFEDGMPRPADYRNFIIKGKTDDLSAIAEVIERRFRTTADGAGDMPRSSYPPGLLLIDGGRPQVQAASRALADLGLSSLPVAGLAKRLEEVWRDDDAPIIMSRTSEGLYLLQRVRDEAHRRAIGFHRKRRSAAVKQTALDTIPGLGKDRAKRLLRHFGSVKRLRTATVTEMCEVPGVGLVLAERIRAQLNPTEES